MHDDLGIITGPDSAPIYPTLQDLLAAVPPSEPVRLIIACSFDVSQPTTVIPANVTVEFISAGRLNVGTGCTVDIHGTVIAPAQQIFFGPGMVYVEGTNNIVNNIWWGIDSGLRLDKVGIAELVDDLAVTGSIQATEEIESGTFLKAPIIYQGDNIVGYDKVNRSGDTMGGPLYLYRDPEEDAEAATRHYVVQTIEDYMIEELTSPGFGIILVNDTNQLIATIPMDSASLVDGYGIAITVRQPLYIVDDGSPIQANIKDDGATPMQYIIEANGIVVSLYEVPASLTCVPTTVIPSTTRNTRVIGSGGPVVLTSNPQIAAGMYDGQVLRIMGRDDTSYVRIGEGRGVRMIGAKNMDLKSGWAIQFRWDAYVSLWTEEYRAEL